MFLRRWFRSRKEVDASSDSVAPFNDTSTITSETSEGHAFEGGGGEFGGAGADGDWGGDDGGGGDSGGDGGSSD